MVGTLDPSEVSSYHEPSPQTPSVNIYANKGFQSVQEYTPRTYNDITVIPEQAPEIHVIRSENFKSQLVEIEAANVIKGIGAEVKCDAPESPVETPSVINKKAHVVSSTDGKQLDYSWLDAKESKFATLLARCGNRLVQLTGEGVLWLEKGKVSVRRDVPLKVSRLWHKWFIPTPTSTPILGQPMPIPHMVVADVDGNAHAIQGLSDEDSVPMWKHESQMFEQRGVSNFPVCTREKLPSSNRLELVGFDPLNETENEAALRKLKRIDGEGIIVFKKQATAPSEMCDCDSCNVSGQVADTTTVAEFIPNPITPTATGAPWLLGYDPVTHTHRYYDASVLPDLKGDEGEQGDQGEQGLTGDRGSQGTVMYSK